MSIAAAVAGTALILLMLWEAFATIVLTRRLVRRINLTRAQLRLSWIVWKAAAGIFLPKRFRQAWLSIFVQLFTLIMLVTWAVGLILGFALIHWGTGPAILGPDGVSGFATDLYFSGSSFFTLGLGDVTPHTRLARLLAVVEAGMGFAFLALIISYLPPLNQNFVQREATVTLLDARAGSPPTAAAMLRRHAGEDGLAALCQLFQEWEIWAAVLLEGHLSFPVLSFFRSQHDNQSWLGGLTAIMDASALVMAGLEGACGRQAERTFAIARHAVVDLSLVFEIPPHRTARDRLPPEALAALRADLAAAGLELRQGEEADLKLKELRQMYEPFVHALADFFQMPIPPWDIGGERKDNWQVSAWTQWDAHSRAGRGKSGRGDHFKTDGTPR
jgi:hypothetical protein